MTRFERFAYVTVVAALLVAWLGLSSGNSTLQQQADKAAPTAGGH